MLWDKMYKLVYSQGNMLDTKENRRNDLGIRFGKRLKYHMCEHCGGMGFWREQRVKKWIRTICPYCEGKGIIPTEAFTVRMSDKGEETYDNEG